MPSVATTVCTQINITSATHTLRMTLTMHFSHHFSDLLAQVVWCVLQLLRVPRGRIQPLPQMGQDLQAHDRKWLNMPAAMQQA